MDNDLKCFFDEIFENELISRIISMIDSGMEVEQVIHEVIFCEVGEQFDKV